MRIAIVIFVICGVLWAQNGANVANPSVNPNGANISDTQNYTPYIPPQANNGNLQAPPIAQPFPIIPESPQGLGANVAGQTQKPSLVQQPIIVEYVIFKEIEQICGGSDYTRLECLVSNLRHFSNRIYTKISGSKSKFAILFYALDSSGKIAYPQEINNKFCEFRDTLGRRFFSKLRGGGFSYVIEYPFSASSSQNRAYISCGFMLYRQQITQTTQPISVIPHSLDISFSIVNATGGMVNLDSGANPHNLNVNLPNLAQNLNAPNESPKNDSEILVLKAQNHTLQISPNATARSLNGEIDKGFSENLVPLYVRFVRDGGLCAPVGEKIEGIARFKNGRFIGGNLNINFDDIAIGTLEIALTNKLDAKDRADGKCLIERESSANLAQNIESIGKIPCQKPIIIHKRVDLIPHSIYALIENIGSQMYYNQHTYIPAIAHLPMMRITLQALNHQNRAIKNFTANCYGRDLSAKLDDNINNFIFINENMPDSIIPKSVFVDSSIARVVRKLSSTGIKDREVTPIDLFTSRVINLNDTFLSLDFMNLGAQYPRYITKPKITNNWRIALMRGRIELIKNINEHQALVANPKISYQFFCKYPECRVVDIESVISPTARLPKASVGSNSSGWYVNTTHPRDFKVLENHLNFENEDISIYSIGAVNNGVQTLALQSKEKGEFGLKIRQSYNENDFPLFLYFAPTFDNIRENLGVETKVKF